MVSVGVARDRRLVANHHLIGIVVNIAGEVLCRRVVSGCDRPCHGELSRGVHLASEQVGNRVSTLHAWLPCAEDGIGVGAP